MPETSTDFTTMLVVLGLMLAVSLWLPRRKRANGGRGLGLGRRRGALPPQETQAAALPDAGKNSKSSELYDVLAQLIRFAKRRRIKLVYPGYVYWKEEKSLSTAVFVGPFGLLALRCFGYGGRVGQAEHGYEWQQSMNGQLQSITNPVQAMEQDSRILRQALAQAGIRDVPVYTAAVYTQPQVQLNAPAGCNVFDRKGLKTWLDSTEILHREAGLDTDQLTETLKTLVQECVAAEKARQAQSPAPQADSPEGAGEQQGEKGKKHKN